MIRCSRRNGGVDAGTTGAAATGAVRGGLAPRVAPDEPVLVRVDRALDLGWLRAEHRLTEVFEVDGCLGPEWQPLIACAARISRLTWLKNEADDLVTASRHVANAFRKKLGRDRLKRVEYGLVWIDHSMRVENDADASKSAPGDMADAQRVSRSEHQFLCSGFRTHCMAEGKRHDFAFAEAKA